MNKEIRVLLIEDDTVDQMAFKRLVAQSNLPYSFVIAGSLAQAKTILKVEHFDIIVTDYHLGDGTAFEIFNLMQNTPFIFITGGGDEETAVKALQEGAFHYMIKDPLRNYLKVLPSTIEKALLHKFNEDERKRAEKELRESEAKHRILLSSISSPVLALKDDMTIFYCNKSYAEFMGKSIEELEGKNILKIFPHLKNSRTFQKYSEVLQSGKQSEVTEKIDGKYIHSRIYKTPWGILSISEDITERVQAEEEIKRKNQELRKAYKKLELLARTDSLTRLSNRRAMWDRINHEIHRFERNKRPFAFIIGDIDNFKKVNDQYGHDAGDFILKEISRILLSSVRKQDTVCRWGGEEFLFLLPETNVDGASVIAEKIRKKIAEHPFVYKGLRISVTMTFGVSVYNKLMNIDNCIKQADLALYKGKKQGKNQVVISKN